MVVFHEQVLRIIDAMTGCGLAEADLVRRHLSKEGGPERTAPWFRAQALARGFDPATTERVWQVVAAFGGFGFCKAHAAAFAIPVYQSAWLKRHHPAAFYAGVLTHDPGMYPKRVIIADARLCGVQVLPVDVNASAADWRTAVPPGDGPPSSRTEAASPVPPHSPLQPARPDAPAAQPSRKTAARGPAVPRPAASLSPPARSVSPALSAGPREPTPRPPQAIRCSLHEVKGISDAEIARIVAGQPYTSLRDFWNRAGVSRPVAERLVLIGAFDSLYRPGPGHASPGAPNVRVAPDSPPRPARPARRCRRPPPPRPSRRDLLARVGVLARQSSPARAGAPAPDLFAETLLAGTGAEAVDAEVSDGMTDLVPPGQLRDLDLAERVAAELEILGFDLSQHVLHFYAGLLTGLGVVRSAELPDRDNGETVLVAGAKVATQTPAVRSGQRIIFASLDDAAGLVDLAFFESVQDRCAARALRLLAAAGPRQGPPGRRRPDGRHRQRRTSAGTSPPWRRSG